MPYFTERELASKPRTSNDIPYEASNSIMAAILFRINEGQFGYPGLMNAAVQKEFPYLEWPPSGNWTSGRLDELDIIEFCCKHLADPFPDGSPFDDGTGSFDPDYEQHLGEHQTEFRQVINRIFARYGLAFELQQNGEVTRLAPAVLSEALVSSVFKTGDRALDDMFESARTKFLSHDPNVRKESLEKLWDAWERLKTLEPGKDKKQSVGVLLDKTAPDPPFRQLLDEEATNLGAIGNNFMIRHTEIDRTPITSEDQVDYLFHRLFAFVRLVLRSTGRGG